MADLKARKITPEEIDRYVLQARRMRAEMVRNMAIGLAGQIRVAIQRVKARAGKSGAGLLSDEPTIGLISKGGRT